MTDASTAPAVRPLGRFGLTVGPIAFGAAPMGNLHRAIDDDVARDTIVAAWQHGVRYFDTAPHYGLGLSERRLGDALHEHPRDEYVLSTKVGIMLEPTEYEPGVVDLENGFDVPLDRVRRIDYSRDAVLRSIEQSLVRLRTDRIDLVLVHDPDDHYREALDGAFPALEELRSQGVIRSYGAGMNQSAMLAAFIRETDLDVVMLAGRFTLLEQAALDDLLPAALERAVSVIAAGVFNSGLLARTAPTAEALYDYAPAPIEMLERAHRLATVCADHGVALPQAAMHFALRHPAVATICVGARSRAQIDGNARLFAQSVPDALWRDLASTGLMDERMLTPGDPTTP